MNRKERYYKTLDILFDAYYQNKIRYRCCGTCPVAQLIAGNMGYKLYDFGYWQNEGVEINYNYWLHLLRCENNLDKKITLLRKIGLSRYELEEKHLAATGYTVAELVMIERAFENSFDEDQGDCEEVSKGLVAVFSVLRHIHQITLEDFEIYNKTRDESFSESITNRLVRRHQSLCFDNKPGGRIYLLR
jgi:hypothetical protein